MNRRALGSMLQKQAAVSEPDPRSTRDVPDHLVVDVMEDRRRPNRVEGTWRKLHGSYIAGLKLDVVDPSLRGFALRRIHRDG
jgi:hypothetical protein